jgi:ribosomal protein L11 methyltransferase
MVWWQLNLVCNEKQALHLSELLDDAGAVAVTLCAGSDEVLCERVEGDEPLWKTTMLKGLFPGTVDAAALIKALEGALAPDILPPYIIDALPDSDWSSSWKSHFKPLRVGRQLWIGPSWYPPPTPGPVNVVLDPGRAFGTGTHATTALCLEWLASANVGGTDMIDYGCGSGILGIAAVKLGARHVFAVDTDPIALDVTQENALRNGVEDALTAVSPEALPRLQVDVLVANILADPLIALAPRFADLVRHSGWAVLSGVLETQADAVMAACRPWFRVKECIAREGWVRILSQRLTERL